MKKQSRKYTDEFKKQAIALAKDLGSVVAAAKQLGVPKVCIYDWRMKLDGPMQQVQDSTVSFNNCDAEELKRLRKENAELKKANYILKSAAAFFSQDHLK